MVPLLLRRVYDILGLTNNGNRDLYSTFGYKRNLTYDDLYFKYLRQGIAARVVDAPAAALWTKYPQLTTNSVEWNDAWQDLVARYKLFHYIGRADRLAGIGNYSILLLGFNDGANLEEPVRPNVLAGKADKILYIQPYSCKTAEILSLDEDKYSSNYGRPKIYRISPHLDLEPVTKGHIPTNILTPFNVHASRIVHLTENTTENDFYGSPRLERVYNTLEDILKVSGGTAETFWLTANRGLHVDVDKEMELSSLDEQNLSDEVKEYANSLSRIIRTRGVKINSLGSDVPNPDKPFDMLIAELSGATGIPRRILTGSEAGQLASEQDRANWAERVKERRNDFGNPIVLFQTIVKLTAAGYLPIQDDLQITIDWPSAYEMSPLENAQTSAQHARSAVNLAKTFETTEELISIDEGRKLLGLDKPEPTFNTGSDIQRVQVRLQNTSSHPHLQVIDN